MSTHFDRIEQLEQIINYQKKFIQKQQVKFQKYEMEKMQINIQKQAFEFKIQNQQMQQTMNIQKQQMQQKINCQKLQLNEQEYKINIQKQQLNEQEYEMNIIKRQLNKKEYDMKESTLVQKQSKKRKLHNVMCSSKQTFIKITRKRLINDQKNARNTYQNIPSTVKMPKYYGDFPFAAKDLCSLRHISGGISRYLPRIPPEHKSQIHNQWYFSPRGTVMFLFAIGKKKKEESCEWMKNNFGDCLPFEHQDDIIEEFKRFNSVNRWKK
jgi:hypothetical protein